MSNSLSVRFHGDSNADSDADLDWNAGWTRLVDPSSEIETAADVVPSVFPVK